MTAQQDFDRLIDKVHDAVSNLSGKAIQRVLLRLDAKANALQNRFFSYLANSAGVFGAHATPTFPGISIGQPKWAPLSTDYVKRKRGKGLTYRTKGGTSVLQHGDRFYINKGNLQRYIARQSSQNKFGPPLVMFVAKGTKGSSAEYSPKRTTTGIRMKVFDKSGSKASQFNPARGNLGTIVIDLFPKLKGPIPSKLDFQALGFPASAGYKLGAYRGSQMRPFMSQYMQWWIRVKAKQLTQGVV